MNIPILKFQKYIFVITGMSYIIDSSGTSKVVQAHEKIFNSNNISYVVIFPISKSKGEGLNWKCKTTGCYGLVIDGEFIEVYTSVEILNFLFKINQNSKTCIGILIHHLIRNDINNIKWMINKIQNVPIIFYIHDFYTCCVNPNLMKNDEISCIDKDVTCAQCQYHENKIKHVSVINTFIKHFDYRIKFVAPSEYTKNIWLTFYPEYNEKTFIIPHQIEVGSYIGNKQTIKNEAPIRMAFIGAQKKIKGWEIFKKIVTETKKINCNYEFYYLGAGTEQLKDVKNINVNIAKQGKNAMIKTLRDRDISLVFLLSTCGETYSYTTFESHAANCFIISLVAGGNIPYLVNSNQWGLVFENSEELFDLLLNEKELRKKINEWKKFSPPGPDTFIDNDKIIFMFSLNAKVNIHWDPTKINLHNHFKKIVLNKIFTLTRLKQRR